MTEPARREFFVYVYRMPEDGTPFYVGKGLKRRISQRLNRSAEFTAVLNSLECSGKIPIVDVFPQPSEEAAYSLERELIAVYGRKNTGTGPLLNRTSGGEGMRDVWLSPEDRQRAREQMVALRADTAVQAKRVDRLRSILRNPTYIENRRKGQKARLLDPAQKAENLKHLRRIRADQNVQERRAASVGASWENPNVRAARQAGISAAMKDGGSERRSKTVKALFQGKQGDSRRQAIGLAAKSRWANPEYRKRLSESNKSILADPERALKHKIKVLLDWERRHLAAGKASSALISRAKAEELALKISFPIDPR